MLDFFDGDVGVNSSGAVLGRWLHRASVGLKLSFIEDFGLDLKVYGGRRLSFACFWCLDDRRMGADRRRLNLLGFS